MRLGKLYSTVAGALLFYPVFVSAHTGASETSASEAATPGDTPAATASTSADGDILVTARRRSETLQSVPIAVTAFDAKALERQQITGLLDVSKAVPGLFISPNQGSQNGATVFIRGEGQDGSAGETETGVGIYVDGVYMARSIGSLLDMNNFDRIEVLRGPQGTLYGRNTPGGAIKIETKRPAFDHFGFAGDVTTGSFNRLDLRGTVNVPMADDFAVNLSAVNLTNDGYYRHALTDQRLAKKDTTSVRLGALWEPTSNLSVYITGDYSRDRSGLQPGTPFNITSGQFVPVYGSLYVAAPDLIDNQKYNGGGTAVTATLSLPHGTLTSISAYRKLHYIGEIDFGASPIGLDFSRDMKNNQFSQELQYLSSYDGMFNFVAGLYYYREFTNERLSLLVPVGTPTYTTPPGTEQKTPLDYPYKQTTDSYSAYGEAYITPFEPLTITLGGRYTHETKKMERTGGVPGLAEGSNDFNNFSPKVNVDFKLSPSAHVYATWSKGFKSGAYQSYPAPALALVITPPEKVEAWELGFKSELIRRVLWFNVAAYHNKYKDIVINYSNTSGIGVVLNSADLRVQGIETELTFRPFDGFSLTGSFSVDDSKFMRVPSSAGAPLITDRGKNLPSYQLRLAPDYVVKLANDKEVEFGGAFTAMGKDQKILPNAPFHLQPAYRIVDGRIQYADLKHGWSLELAAKNIGNAHIFMNSTFQGGTTSAVRWYEPGRTWSLKFGYKF